MTQRSSKLPPLAQNFSIHAGNIKSITIAGSAAPGQKYKQKEITGAVSEVFFYESVLATTVSATLILVDTGFEAPKKVNRKLYENVSTSGLINELNLKGGEVVEFEIEDNNPYNVGNDRSTIKMKMYVNRIRDIDNNTLKNTFVLDLVSKEFLLNENTRVLRRYDGPISESISKILDFQNSSQYDFGVGSQSLGSFMKRPEIQTTKFSYNFIGNTKKPLYVCQWLAAKAVPQDKKSNSQAGYFFYQTRERFHFVSVDASLNGKTFITDPEKGAEKKVKEFFYTNTGANNEDEGANILNYSVKRTTDLQKDLALGVFHNFSQYFDFFGMNYKFYDYDVTVEMKDLLDNRSTKDFLNIPTRAVTERPSRYMTHILDIGTLPEGKNSTQQLANWRASRETRESPNYKAEQTMAQSIMRYNQLFSVQLTILVPGDFTISAGDPVNIEITSLNAESAEPDAVLSGTYMVANVCHKINSSETLTSMDLIRDTRGIK